MYLLLSIFEALGFLIKDKKILQFVPLFFTTILTTTLFTLGSFTWLILELI